MNVRGPKKMTLDALADLESKCREAQASKRQKLDKSAKQQFSARTTMSTFNKDTAHLLAGVMDASNKTPMARRPSALSPHTLSASQSDNLSPGSAFATRADTGKVVCAFNPAAGVVAHSCEQLALAAVPVASPSVLGESFMWERLDDCAKLLDSQVSALERSLGARTDLPPVQSVVATGPEDVTVVGRVCCEGEGKLNAKSIFLEGSRPSSNACRVRLDLASCPEYALFPGQVVGLVGVNSMGHTFVVKRVLPAHPPPGAGALRRPAASLDASATILTAAGPFTTTDDLTYAPLAALLTRASLERPDALVLVGPFVDDAHPKVASGEVPVSFHEVFGRQVVAPLCEFIETQMQDDEGHVTHVVLIPSPRDVHHLPAYPQSPLQLPRDVPAHVHPFLHVHTNPSTFTVGGVRIAASSVDSIMVLGAQELAKAAPVAAGAPKPDRMVRLASHMLQQRHMLPIVPIPAAPGGQPLPVDMVANVKAGGLPTLPEVLITPSDLAPFAKIGFGGVLCVNPGRLTRKAAGGNYATISIHPQAAVEAAAEAAEAKAKGVWMQSLEDEEATPDALLAAAAPPAKEGEAASQEDAPSPIHIKPEVLEASVEEARATDVPSATDAPSATDPPSATAPAAAAEAKVDAEAAADKPNASNIEVPWTAPDDAPLEMAKRAFVEVKRI